MRKWIGFLGLLLVAAPVAADPYFGVNFTKVDYNEDGFATVSPTALTLRVGTQVNPNIAVEGRLGVGLSDDSINVGGVNVDVEVDSYFGLYLKGMAPLGAVSPYVLVGFTKGELTFSALGGSLSEDDSSASFGIGVDVEVSKSTALNFEFAQLLDEDGYEVETLSAGVAFRF